MPRDYKLYLDDILESCRKIRRFTEGMSFEEFQRDVKTQDAVIRNFEVIGEAANRLPEEIRKRSEKKMRGNPLFAKSRISPHPFRQKLLYGWR